MTARPTGTSSPTPRTARPAGGSGGSLPLRRHLGLGVDQVHRRRAGRLVLPAHLPGRGVPDSVGQHGEHPADRGLPVREQGALRRRGPAHPHAPARGARAAPERHPGVRFGRGGGAQGRQAPDRHAGRHARRWRRASCTGTASGSTSPTRSTAIRTAPRIRSSGPRCGEWQVPHLVAAGHRRATSPISRTGARSWCRPDSFFMMGDNRDSSYDGRYWGFLPRGNVRGRPLVVYFSYDQNSWQVAAVPHRGAVGPDLHPARVGRSAR